MKMYRFETECINNHVWIGSPTDQDSINISHCPICGGEVAGFERYTVGDKFNFVIESAESLNFKDKKIREKRFYIAIQDSSGKFVARNPKTFSWDDAISIIAQIKDINHKILIKLLRSKNWSIY